MSEDTKDDLQSRLEDLRNNAFVLEEETDEVASLIDSDELEDAEGMIEDFESERI
jgi:hypothetical protein